MTSLESSKRSPALVLALAAIIVTAFMWMFLRTETQTGIAVLLAAAIGAVVLSRKFGATQRLEQAAASRPGLARLSALGGMLALIAAFYNVHFGLLMICSVFLYTTRCLWLT